MRGYEKAKKQLGLDFLAELYIDLSNSYIRCNPNLEKFLDKTKINLKYSLRQFVISRLLGCTYYSLNKVLLKAIEDGKPITYSLPREYIIKLEKKGFKVNKFSSLTLWRILILLEFLRGIKEAIFYIFRNIIYKINKVKIKKVDAYFLDQNPNILPNKFQRELNCQCFNYFGEKFFKQKHILFAHGIKIRNKKFDHNVSIEFRKYPFGYLSSWLEILKLIYFLFIQIIYFPINIFSSKLLSTILLSELFFAKVCSLQKKKFLAKTYLFDNSYIFRPFWTFIAEKKRSEIIYYFYSTNCISFKNKARISSLVSYHYRNLNWPNYVFWNKYQEKAFKRFLEKPYTISISGPICINNTELKENFKLPGRTISVFNITPVRNSFYKTLGLTDEYFVPKHCISFIKDILTICEKNNITLCFKSKRGIKKSTHPSYIKFINSISNKANVLIIPEKTSPYDLIKKTDISIAMPFTSTPHYSKVLKKPSCYYDSSGFINKNHEGAQGVEIIVGLNQLNNWVLKQINF